MMYFVFFFFGIFTVVAQLILARELFVVFFGQELAIGAIIAGWLVSVALGAYVYPKIADRIKNQFFWYSVLVPALPLLLFVEIIITRNLRALFMVPGFALFPLPMMLLAVLLVLLPFAFLTGLLFPLGTDSAGKKDKLPSVSPYLFMILGNMAGGLLFVFVFAPYLNHFAAAFITSAALFICLLFSVKWLKLKRYFIYFFTAGLALSLYIIAGSAALDSYYNLQRWKTFSSGMELLHTRDSKYQNMSIGVRDGQYSVFENGRPAISFPDDFTEAQFIHPVMLQHKRPKNVLFLGLPTNAVIREMAHYGIETAEFVQADPLLAVMISSLQNLRDIKKTELINGEGRSYLKNAGKKYDLIICNLPVPSTAFLSRYYTREFYGEVRASLTPEGVFITKISSFGEELPGYDAATYFTLKSVFPVCMVSSGDIKYFFASDGNYISMNADELRERYKKRRINSEYFNRYVFKTIFEKDRIAELVKELEERKEKVIYSDVEPTGYFLNLQYWVSLTGSRLPSMVKLIFDPRVIFPLLILIFYPVYKRKPKPAFGVKISAVISGFSGAFLFIIALLMFQNIRGSMYGMLGLFTCLFFAGVCIGIFTAAKLKNITASKVALVHGAFVPVAVVTAGSVYIFGSGSMLIYCLYFVCLLAGLVTGLSFPLTVKLSSFPGIKVVRSTSANFAYYNLGGAVGVFLGALFILPVAGLIGSCVLIILINLFSGILLTKRNKGTK